MEAQQQLMGFHMPGRVACREKQCNSFKTFSLLNLLIIFPWEDYAICISLLETGSLSPEIWAPTAPTREKHLKGTAPSLHPATQQPHIIPSSTALLLLQGTTAPGLSHTTEKGQTGMGSSAKGCRSLQQLGDTSVSSSSAASLPDSSGQS